MHYLQGDSREQLYTTSLEDEVKDDNEVRILDILVDLILKQVTVETYQKGKSNVDRKAYSSSDLLKLYIYGYLNRIQSSRRLERECHRNLELKWLLSNLAPDFKTIADFRKDNYDLIGFVTLAFRKMLLSANYAMGQVLVLDGTKVKGNASRRTFTHEKIEEMLNKAKRDHLRYLNVLQATDIKEDTEQLEEEDVSAEKLKEKIAEIEQKIALYAHMKEISESDNNREVSRTDPESRLLNSQSSKTFNGYNVQTVVDELNKLILGAFVCDDANDINQMVPALDTVERELGIKPERIVADCGYNNTAAIREVEDDYKVETYVAIKDEEKVKPFSKQSFKFDPELNIYTCPEGHTLVQKGGTNKKGERQTLSYFCDKKTCDQCPSRPDCTSSTKNGRKIARYTDEMQVEEYREKMNSKMGKAIIKERKAIVEHVFGVIKCWMGKIPLLLRGKRNVQTEIDLYATTYNIKRLLKLKGFDFFQKMILSAALPQKRLSLTGLGKRMQLARVKLPNHKVSPFIELKLAWRSCKNYR